MSIASVGLAGFGYLGSSGVDVVPVRLGRRRTTVTTPAAASVPITGVSHARRIPPSGTLINDHG
jgi:hypothetical protein